VESGNGERSQGSMRGVRTVAELASLMVSPMTGILKRLVLSPRYGDEVPIIYPLVVPPDYSRLPLMHPIATPGGTSFRVEDSVARALFETIERYCGAFVDRERMICSKPVSEEFLYGDSLPLYADFQYEQEGWPFRQLTGNSRIWWVEGQSLFTGRRVFVPAVLVYVPYHSTSQEEAIGPSVSTGMAASWSWESACLAGLLEVCERDAFAIMWMNSLSMPRIKPHPSSKLAQELKTILPFGSSVEFVNITNDLGVPTVVAVFHYSYLGKPLVTVGAASKPSLYQACEKAFAEAANGYARVVSQLNDPKRTWYPAPDFSNVTDWEWHSLLYGIRPELQGALSFMTASAEQQFVNPESDAPTLDDRDALQALLARLKGKFNDIVAVELTTRDFAELGVSAVRIMVPEAIPLHPDHRYPRLGHRRLYQVPHLLGFSEGNTTPETLNKDPHPFS